jgi:hypothetical protein
MGVGSAGSIFAESDAGLLVVDVIIDVAQIPDSKISSKLSEKNFLMLRRIANIIGKN